MKLPHVLGLGTCQLHNPLTNLDRRSEVRSIMRWQKFRGTPDMPYSFTPSEHKQTLQVLLGELDMPSWIRAFCNLPIAERPIEAVAADIMSADVVLCEICSPHEMYFGDWQLNICRVFAKITEAVAGNAEALKAARQWFHRGILDGKEAIRESTAAKYLELCPEIDDEAAACRTVVKYARLRRAEISELESDLLVLREFMPRPLGIVTHIIRYMPDGRPISWPLNFREQIIAMSDKLGVPVLDPCQLVLKYGYKTALLQGNEQHWSWDFMPTVGDLYKDFLFERVLDAGRPVPPEMHLLDADNRS